MAQPFLLGLLAWRGEVPNIADKDSRASVRIAEHLFAQLGVTRALGNDGASSGSALEDGVRDYLAEALLDLEPGRAWVVMKGGAVTEFSQYEHLARLQAIMDADSSGLLSVEIGRDYQVRPDVTVGLAREGEAPILHAAVSCKFTIRSDRVQNIRHEAVILTRHRRGRQPHIVAVTAEPLPTRLAAIARGTGEIDALYHVALPELSEATEAVGTREQRDVLSEIVGQNRVFDLGVLPGVLSI